MDASAWSPEAHNDRLTTHRAYHARHAWELTVMLQSTPEDYVCRQSLTVLRVAALLELRQTEIELASFQLTCNAIGFRLDDREALYGAAVWVYAAHLYLFDQVAVLKKKKTGRKDVLAMAPSRTDSPRQLASNLDKNMHALHVLLKMGADQIKVSVATDPDGVVMRMLTRRLEAAVKSLDKVVVVTPDCEGAPIDEQKKM